MMLTDVGFTFMGLILYIPGLWGRANTICALKGSSVDLPCSAKHPASNSKWFTVHWEEYSAVQSELSTDGNHATYNMSEGSNFTLTIKDLRESDENMFCCRENTNEAALCWLSGIQLHVADLQVKVIPTTEGQTVTLMCSTSCPLTEKPAAYIWYKNREFLYQDWSPWYQQLVSSDEAVTYSCAVKGYEDLRAPEVSVDSVTSACFSVTYAKGRMCSDKQTSEDEPCSITYPTEVHVQRTPAEGYVTLSCTTSCPLIGSQTAYMWYQNGQLNSYTESRDYIVSRSSDKRFSCEVKDHKDLLSAEVCTEDKNCWSVNYISRRICALKGSSVNISSEYSHPENQQPKSKYWYKIKRGAKEEAEELIEAAGRVEYDDNMNGRHILGIKSLTRDDSGEYIFRLQQDGEQKQSNTPTVTLVVTGLTVTFTPSAEVTEGQRVTLTCSTSCPLPDHTNYTWYKNSRPLTLPENQYKHLVLDPVNSQHAGNYSCAVKTHNNIIKSREKTLTVHARGELMAIINVVRLTVIPLIPIPLLVFNLWMRRRKKKTLTSTADDRSGRSTHCMRASHYRR